MEIYNYEEILEFLKKIIKEAGKILIENYDNPRGIRKKDDNTLVSDADKKVSDFLFNSLKEKYPDFGILDEERSEDERFKEFCFIIDPLDGTKEYLKKIDEFSILIGLIKNFKPVLSIAYKPTSGELAYAIKGNGAFLEKNNKKIKLKVIAKKEIIAFISRTRKDENLDNLLGRLNAKKIQLGSMYKIIEIAKNTGNVVVYPISLKVHIWDICAPQIILEEAGGIITDLIGGKIDYSKNIVNGIIATSSLETHKKILDLLDDNIKPILIFCGLMGSGKTTLSEYFLEKLEDYERFNTDDVRRIMGLKTFDRKDTPKVNEFMYSHARQLLKERKGVMFDSAYKLKKAREKIYEIGKELNVPVLVVECYCKPETAVKRISSRGKTYSLHNPTNDPKVYEEYAKIWESPEIDIKDDNISLIKINTDNNVLEIIKLSKELKEIVDFIEKNLEQFKLD